MVEERERVSVDAAGMEEDAGWSLDVSVTRDVKNSTETLNAL